MAPLGALPELPKDAAFAVTVIPAANAEVVAPMRAFPLEKLGISNLQVFVK